MVSSPLIFTLISYVLFVNGQIQFNGKCNNVTTQSMFNMTKYLGKWYEVEKFPTIFQRGSSCLSVSYNNGTNGCIEMENTMLLNGHNITITGTTEEINPEIHDGKLKVNLTKLQETNTEYWVLGTDYDHYSVVWSCIQNNQTNEQYAWILSRTKNETESQRNEVMKILEKNKLDIDHFMKVNQTHCIEKKHKKNSATSVARINQAFVFFLFIVKQIF